MDIGNYWTTDVSFVFMPEFNEQLDNYKNSIKKYKKLFFSNHIRPSKFNKSLEKSFEQLIQLEELTFGFNFNQPLYISLSYLINLKKLTFGDNFNQPLNNSLEQLFNLEQLIFGDNFNQSINPVNKLKKLTNLYLGLKFDQELYLSSNIKILTLNCNNQNLIDMLPNTIEQLKFDLDFNLPLDNLPNSIKKISFSHYKYDHELNNLPKSLEILQLPHCSKFKINNLPTDCKIIYKNNYN